MKRIIQAVFKLLICQDNSHCECIANSRNVVAAGQAERNVFLPSICHNLYLMATNRCNWGQTYQLIKDLRMIFWRFSKRPLNPPPCFGKICFQYVSNLVSPGLPYSFSNVQKLFFLNMILLDLNHACLSKNHQMSA